MTVTFKVGDLDLTSGSPEGAIIAVDEIKDHTGSSGVDGQVLNRDLTGLLWTDFPQASLSGAGLVQLSDSTSSISTYCKEWGRESGEEGGGGSSGCKCECTKTTKSRNDFRKGAVSSNQKVVVVFSAELKRPKRVSFGGGRLNF